MNFQAIEQANGKNVTIWATMTTWDGISFSANKAKLLTCKLKDDDNIEHKCRIYEGKGALPGQELLNQRMQFNLSAYQGNYQGTSYTGYSGFWSHGATSSAPQNGQRASQHAPQSTNYRQPAPQGKKEPERSDTEGKVIRRGLVCAMLQGGITVDYDEVLRHTVFVMTGIDPDNAPEPHKDITEPQYKVNEEYVGDGKEGICPHCQKLLEDCTCQIPF